MIENPKIYGVDIENKKIIDAENQNIIALLGDVQKKLPFKSNFFDVISANQIIEHLVDLDTFFSEIKRVLKSQGYLVISTENLTSCHNIFSLVLGSQAFSQAISRVLNIGNPLRIHPKRRNLSSTSGMHIKILSFRGLKELAQIHGFRIKKSFGAAYYPFPPPITHLLSRLDPRHAVFIGLKARND